MNTMDVNNTAIAYSAKDGVALEPAIAGMAFANVEGDTRNNVSCQHGEKGENTLLPSANSTLGVYTGPGVEGSYPDRASRVPTPVDEEPYLEVDSAVCPPVGTRLTWMFAEVLSVLKRRC
jgi:hypothetical protein